MFEFSPTQCAAGRALARCSTQALANKAGVPLATVQAFEDGRAISTGDRQKIFDALHGRLFLRPIPETAHAGEGVRLRKTLAGRNAEIRSRIGGVEIAPSLEAASSPARR